MNNYIYAFLCRRIRLTSFLFLLTLTGITTTTFATNYYVDRDASGNGSGTSWANASTKLSACHGRPINAGDTVYISGGNDSTVYSQTDQILQINLISGGYSYVVITKGKDAGHNGDVCLRILLPQNALDIVINIV